MDAPLDIFFTILTLGCAVPAWVQLIRAKGNRGKVLTPVSLLTGSVLAAVLFENLITFGPLALDYSLRFAALGCPLSLLAIVFARSRTIGCAAPWIWAGAGGSLVVWLLLVTMH